MTDSPINPHAVATCPSCGGVLAGGRLADVCPSCAWSILGSGSEVGAAAMAEGDGALFAVRGHDVLAEIARGGGGIVYRAIQHEPRREVALKILPPHQLASPEMRARFRTEAETVASLDHPAILPVHVVGEHDGMPFFTMKLATGGTLAARRESLAGRWREIATIVAELADAVQYAHERGVIHRDLKPGNILFDEQGRAYVSDFGLAKFTTASAGVTLPHAVLGTPAYLAPETAERGVAAATVASDIYGLGAILYELLSGQPPFAADSLVALLKRIAVQAPARPRSQRPDVPRDLEVICLRALAKEPAGRFATAGAFAGDLRRWLGRRPIESRPVPAAERAWFWARRNPALAALSLVLAAGLLASGVVLAESNRHFRAAQAESREQLRAALVSEGRLLRLSGRQGQRHDALVALEHAARLRGGVDVRREIAGALARPDLRLVQSVATDHLGELTVSGFSPDLATYLDLAPAGGFALRRTAGGATVREFRTEGTAAPDNFAFSADGRRVRVSFRRGNHEVWSIESGQRLWAAARGAIALHPHAAIAAIADDKGVRTVDLAGGVETLLDATAHVRALAFDPSGKRLAAVSDGECLILDVASATVVARIAIAGNATVPAWSPDGRRLAVGGAPGYSLHVVDTERSQIVQILRNPTARLVGVQFHPDNRRLFTLARDNTLRLWDALSGDELLRASMAPRALAVSPDGQRVGAAVSQKELGIFELAPAIVAREFLGRALSGRQAHTAATSPDGAWLATCDPEEIRVWDVERGREVASFPFVDDDLTSVHFAPDGAALLYSGTSRGVYRRTVHASPESGAFELGAEEALGANRDGRLMGFTRDGRDWFIDREGAGRVVVWPGGRSEGERVCATSGRSERPEFSPDGRWVVTMGYRQVKVQVWAAAEASPWKLLPIERHSGAEFSPDSRWLLTSNMEEFRLWSLPDLQPAHAWPTLGRGGLGWGTTAFAPDARIVALEQEGGQIAIFDVDSGEERITLPALPVGGLSQVLWSRDGQQLFLTHDDQRIWCWEIAALRRELAARGLDW